MSSTAVGDPFTAVPDHQLPRRPCRSRGRRETNRSPTTGHTAHTRNPGPPNWCPQRRLARRAERPAPVVRLRTCLICAASCRPGAVVRCWAICAHDLYRSRKCRLCARPSWSPRQMGARRGADLCRGHDFADRRSGAVFCARSDARDRRFGTGSGAFLRLGAGRSGVPPTRRREAGRCRALGVGRVHDQSGVALEGRPFLPDRLGVGGGTVVAR
jgi:hypothetical protein